jgi:hypothetical protein
MRLSHRVQKLERAARIMWPPSALDRYEMALNDAALRLTGIDFNSLRDNDPAVDLVSQEVLESFVQKLSDADRASLMADLEQIAFGGDPVAIEAAKQEARREFWKQALTIASDIVRYRFG